MYNPTNPSIAISLLILPLFSASAFCDSWLIEKPANNFSVTCVLHHLHMLSGRTVLIINPPNNITEIQEIVHSHLHQNPCQVLVVDPINLFEIIVDGYWSSIFTVDHVIWFISAAHEIKKNVLNSFAALNIKVSIILDHKDWLPNVEMQLNVQDVLRAIYYDSNMVSVEVIALRRMGENRQWTVYAVTSGRCGNDGRRGNLTKYCQKNGSRFDWIHLPKTPHSGTQCPMRVLMIENPPFVYRSEGRLRGIDYEFMQSISNILSVNVSFDFVEDRLQADNMRRG